MSRVNEVKDFVDSFLSEEECRLVDFQLNEDELKLLGYESDDGGWTVFNINNEDEYVEGIEGLLKLAELKFGINIEFDNVGGFDSPGYDVDCYAWASVVDGELYFDTVQHERY